MNRKRVLSTLFLPASLVLSRFLPVTSYGAQSYHAERATSTGTTYTQLTKYDEYICYYYFVRLIRVARWNNTSSTNASTKNRFE
jgi:hypothetical protein